MEPFASVNFPAVLLAGVADFLIGGVWYSQFLFARPWMKALGKTEKDLEAAKKKGMGKLLFFSFLSALVMASVLAVVLTYFDTQTFPEAFQAAFLVWLGFLFAGSAPHYLFAGRPLNLFLIDAGYNLAKLLAMAAVIFAMK